MNCRSVFRQEAIYIQADPIRLAQVFSNLLNNAAKFTPPGGCVQLIAERHGTDVVVTVRDNGIGIPAGDLSRIFEIFAQVGRGTQGTMSGIGIGLALAKRLVGNAWRHDRGQQPGPRPRK